MTERADLVAFIAARLAEDEATAVAASAGPWVDALGDVREPNVAEGQPGNWVANAGVTDRAHIARHDPARVLREVAAKRRILDLYEELNEPALYEAMEALATVWSPGIVVPPV